MRRCPAHHPHAATRQCSLPYEHIGEHIASSGNEHYIFEVRWPQDEEPSPKIEELATLLYELCDPTSILRWTERGESTKEWFRQRAIRLLEYIK